jgi:hypothetical protein
MVRSGWRIFSQKLRGYADTIAAEGAATTTSLARGASLSTLWARPCHRSPQRRCPSWVMTDKTQSEHNDSPSETGHQPIVL